MADRNDPAKPNDLPAQSGRNSTDRGGFLVFLYWLSEGCWALGCFFGAVLLAVLLAAGGFTFAWLSSP